MSIPHIPQTAGIPPKPSNVTAAAPAVPVTVLPPGLVYRFPAVFGAYFGGSGALSADLSGSMVMGVQFGSSGALVPVVAGIHTIQEQFNGTGDYTVFIRPLESLTADFAGLGGMDAYLEEFTGIGADLSGSGELLARIRPVINADFNGSGELLTTSGIAAGAGANGSLSATVKMVGVLNANFAGAGSFNPTLVVFNPSGMNKSGSMAMPQSYGLITGWVADTANFPGSTVTSNGLVIQSNITNATLMAQLSVTKPGNSQSSVVDIRFYKNGSTLLGTAPSPGVTVPVGATTLVQGTLTGVSLTAGDVITIHAQKTTAFSATVDAANSWVRVLAP